MKRDSSHLWQPPPPAPRRMPWPHAALLAVVLAVVVEAVKRHWELTPHCLIDFVTG
jgi:hypothetical protein